MSRVALCFVHHANQYLVTNGYTNRCGLSDTVGDSTSTRGYLKVLDLHKAYQIPLSLHVSGTLLESLVWSRPDLLVALQELRKEGLLDLVGSSYGQNIMRFFSHEHNAKQLTEELELYRNHLELNPMEIKIFWPPERVWDTGQLAPVLTDPGLPNGGYKYVLLDDRLLYSTDQGLESRRSYDKAQKWRFEDFTPHRIRNGQGLIALPLSNVLRRNVPPRDANSTKELERLCRWLLTFVSSSEGTPGNPSSSVIGIYGDDLEKAAGIGGWDSRGPAQYEAVLQWITQNDWVRAVKLTEWASRQTVTSVKRIDTGTFVELSNDFEAGEGYEKWYFDPKWDVYRSYYAWSEWRVKGLTDLGADPALIELAWKQLLAASWETAWHTPSSGVHGNPSSQGDPSPWSKATTSHARLAAVTAEAGFWMRHKDEEAHAYTCDLDNDGDEELVLKNDKLFAVFSPRWGGRLVYLYCVEGRNGKMVIGNPCDDWNWMEELNKYMEVPANHPGALTELGYENDRYAVQVETGHGSEVKVSLINAEGSSHAQGLKKELRLSYGSHEIEATYHLPAKLPTPTIECGFSPDYLSILRFGKRTFSEIRDPSRWGYSNNGISAWVRVEGHSHDSGIPAPFNNPAARKANVREFGHGQAIRFKTMGSNFVVYVGSRQREKEEDHSPS